MSLNISDPLSLLPYQSGLADPVLIEAAAQAADDLTAQQQAYKIGDPVPIVFCRRVSDNGGVMVSPGATEARYENDGTTNALTVSLHLVLSEGELPTIPIKDVFVGPCRQGTWDQNYDRRSGTWFPGNFVTDVAGKQPWACPYYCGTSGRYENMTTLSYVNTFVDGSERWEHQVHIFVREGMKVTRIIDSTLGPSNNVIDLAIYLMNESGRIPSTLIDSTQMLAAANFCDTNGLLYNGVFKESINLDEWLEQIGNDFLLRLVEIDGKFGFKPRLPVNVDHTIKTTAIDWVFTFTEDHLLPDGFEIQYIPLEDRLPVCLQMMWRQQPDADIGFPRTTEVRFTGEATDGPFEQYDLSQFCTSETHAVKVGAYRLARRKYITHTLRLKVRPSSYNSTLTLGDMVRVRLRRETATTALDYHDFLYEVERIEKTASGACVFDLTHLPIDDQGRSLVALEVAAATAPGVLINPGRSDYSCDDNSSSDATPLGSSGRLWMDLFDAVGDLGERYYPPLPTSTSVALPAPSLPTTKWAEGGYPPIGPNVSQPAGEPSGAPSPIGSWGNPIDKYQSAASLDIIEGASGDDGVPLVGDTLAVRAIGEGYFDCIGQVCWYKENKNTGEITEMECQEEPINNNYYVDITTDEIDHYIRAVGRCKDPSTASGYGEPRTLGQTAAVQCVAESAYGGNISGTAPPEGNTTGGTWRLSRTAGTFSYYNTNSCTSTITSNAGDYDLYTVSNVVAVAFTQTSGTCGPTSFTFELTLVGGSVVTRTPASTAYGFSEVNYGFVMSWDGPDAVDWTTPC